MSWRIDTSKNAEKFLKENHPAKEELFELVKRAIQYFRGERVNIDIRKLKGRWKGFYRIRKGKLRIIAEFDFENSVIFVEEIDWRGNVYK